MGILIFLLLLFTTPSTLSARTAQHHHDNHRHRQQQQQQSSSNSKANGRVIEVKGGPESVIWVVQLSDLHLSVHHPDRASDFKANVGPVLSIINPSLVLITGDLTGFPHFSFSFLFIFGLVGICDFHVYGI